MRFQMIAATDVGQVREVNEDSLRIMPDHSLAVVADGMGGHKAGDIASRMAVNSLCDYFQEQAVIREEMEGDTGRGILSDAFALANSQVYAHSHQAANCEGMGTSMVAAAFQEDKIHIGHIGDSRFYRFSHGEREQLTVDHPLAPELSQDTPAWELPAYSHHVLRKALGIEATCAPDFLTVEHTDNQIYLICSDGLTGVLSDQEIGTMLTLRAGNPEQCLESMISACLDNGAPDNVSIILAIPTPD